jgi:hypothetical protein
MPKPSGIVILACAWMTAASLPCAAACPRAVAAPSFEPSSGPALQLFGTLQEMQGNNIVIATRNGQRVTVDATPALSAQMSTVLVPGHAYDILGTLGPNGEVRADVIRRTSGAPPSWKPDCMPSQ